MNFIYLSLTFSKLMKNGIMQGSELPTMLNFSVRCAFYGEDFCVINSRELKNKSEITIGVSCLEECDFRLQTEVSEELLLETGR